jgi:hypothetical protein
VPTGHSGATGEILPALPLVAAVLDTAWTDQREFEQAFAAISALRHSAPDCLLLAITDATLRYLDPTQGYAPADAVLVDFGRNHRHDTPLRYALEQSRAALMDWAKEAGGRGKRDALTTIVVSGSRIGDIPPHVRYEIAMRRSQMRRPPLRQPPKADNAATAPQLGKQLASEAQLAELRTTGGIKIAGPGKREPVHDAPRLISTYGGKVADWFKVSSLSYRAQDGTQFEIHAYWNISTKQLVEPKSIVIRAP